MTTIIANSIKNRAAQGAKWTVAATLIAVAARAILIVIVARILSPQEIGLYGICVLVIGFVQVFMDAGLGSAVVHFQKANSRQLNTLYWLNVLAGLLCCAVLLAATSLLVPLYGEPALDQLIPLCAMTILIHAFGQPFQYILQRDLLFPHIAVTEVLASLTNAVVAIGLAIAGWGVYALVAGFVSFSVVRSISLLATGLRRWQPGFSVSFDESKELIAFSVYHMGSRLVNYLSSRSGQLAVSLILGTEAMGYYVFACDIILRPVDRLGPLINRVLFPTLAKVQDDLVRVRRAYRYVLKIVLLFGAPSILGLIAIAPVIVPSLLGPSWQPVTSLLQVLGVVAICRVISSPNGPLLLALGLAKRAFLLNTLQALVQLPVALLAFHLGGLMIGVVALATLQVLQTGLSYRFVLRHACNLQFRECIAAMAKPLMSGLAMMVCVSGLPFIVELQPYSLLSCQLLVGSAVYCTLVVSVDRHFLADVLRQLTHRTLPVKFDDAAS